MKVSRRSRLINIVSDPFISGPLYFLRGLIGLSPDKCASFLGSIL
jgi:hypothetical protein